MIYIQTSWEKFVCGRMGWESKQTISSLKLWHALSQLHAMPTINPSYLAPHGFNLENLFPCYCLFSLNRPKTKQSIIQYVRIVANGIFLPPRPDSFLITIPWICSLRTCVSAQNHIFSFHFLSFSFFLVIVIFKINYTKIALALSTLRASEFKHTH